MLYQTLGTDRSQIRLISILPLAPGTSESASVECILQEFGLDEESITPAYRTYLADKDGLGAWRNPESYFDRLSPGDELAGWIHIPRPNDNATSHLPIFRYVWGDYLALSYTWGDPSNTRKILVNGEQLVVTQNVEACLRALRKKDYTQSGWKFWIDAICINQEDIIERASQVKRMREIYTKAWTPIIWLGEQTEGSDGALDLILTLSNHYSSRDGVSKLTNTLHRNAEHFGQGCWGALNEILCRRYWRRLWILQEAALGRSTTPVLCGDRTLPWISFARACNLLIKTDEVINTYIANELDQISRPFALWGNLYTVSEIQCFQNLNSNGQRANLYRLLHLTRTVFSTDPRDKVYGLLGLMEKPVVNLIKPDYKDTVVNVYRSFTLAAIEGTGSLDVLRHSTLNEGTTIPTWVPDWTSEPTDSTLSIADTAFCASGPSLASIRSLSDDQLLLCKGFIADGIDGMGCLPDGMWPAESVVPTMNTANPYITLQEAREAIWKTLVASHSIPSEPLDPSLYASYASLLATPTLATMDFPEHSPLSDLVSSNVFLWCVQFLEGHSSFRVAGRPMSDFFSKEVDLENMDAGHLRDALMQRDRVGLGRRLVTTGKGYFGIAPLAVKQDDVIAVLLGCSVPVLLRKVNGQSGEARWRIVGECYVHGIMNGEAMEWESDIQDIVIC